MKSVMTKTAGRIDPIPGPDPTRYGRRLMRFLAHHAASATLEPHGYRECLLTVEGHSAIIRLTDGGVHMRVRGSAERHLSLRKGRAGLSSVKRLCAWVVQYGAEELAVRERILQVEALRAAFLALLSERGLHAGSAAFTVKEDNPRMEGWVAPTTGWITLHLRVTPGDAGRLLDTLIREGFLSAGPAKEAPRG